MWSNAPGAGGAALGDGNAGGGQAGGRPEKDDAPEGSGDVGGGGVGDAAGSAQGGGASAIAAASAPGASAAPAPDAAASGASAAAAAAAAGRTSEAAPPTDPSGGARAGPSATTAGRSEADAGPKQVPRPSAAAAAAAAPASKAARTDPSGGAPARGRSAPAVGRSEADAAGKRAAGKSDARPKQVLTFRGNTISVCTDQGTVRVVSRNGLGVPKSADGAKLAAAAGLAGVLQNQNGSTVPRGITCHKCAGKLHRAPQSSATCEQCGISFHTYDCGHRYEDVGMTEYIRAHPKECPKCNHICVCSGGKVLCNAAKAKAARRARKEERLAAGLPYPPRRETAVSGRPRARPRPLTAMKGAASNILGTAKAAGIEPPNKRQRRAPLGGGEGIQRQAPQYTAAALQAMQAQAMAQAMANDPSHNALHHQLYQLQALQGAVGAGAASALLPLANDGRGAPPMQSAIIQAQQAQQRPLANTLNTSLIVPPLGGAHVSPSQQAGLVTNSGETARVALSHASVAMNAGAMDLAVSAMQPNGIPHAQVQQGAMLAAQQQRQGQQDIVGQAQQLIARLAQQQALLEQQTQQLNQQQMELLRAQQQAQQQMQRMQHEQHAQAAQRVQQQQQRRQQQREHQETQQQVQQLALQQALQQAQQREEQMIGHQVQLMQAAQPATFLGGGPGLPPSIALPNAPQGAAAAGRAGGDQAIASLQATIASLREELATVRGKHEDGKAETGRSGGLTATVALQGESPKSKGEGRSAAAGAAKQVKSGARAPQRAARTIDQDDADAAAVLLGLMPAARPRGRKNKSKKKDLPKA